jgi:hypothetical protein
LGGIDHRNGETGINQEGGQAHPVGAGGLHHHQNGAWVRFEGSQLSLEFGKAGSGLVDGYGTCRFVTTTLAGNHTGRCSDINTDKQAKGWRCN